MSCLSKQDDARYRGARLRRNAPNTRPPACSGGRFLFTPTLAGRMRDASLKKFLGRDSRIRVIASPPHLPELWGVRGAVAPAAPGYSGITITAPEHGRRSRRDDSEIEEGWGMRRIRRRALWIPSPRSGNFCDSACPLFCLPCFTNRPTCHLQLNNKRAAHLRPGEGCPWGKKRAGE